MSFNNMKTQNIIMLNVKKTNMATERWPPWHHFWALQLPQLSPSLKSFSNVYSGLALFKRSIIAASLLLLSFLALFSRKDCYK